MFCKNCHYNGKQDGVCGPHMLMEGKRVCNTCETTRDFSGNGDRMFFKSQAARKLLCHPLPSAYRSQEAEGVMLDVKSSRLTMGIPGPKLSAPLAVRTFDVDEFAFGAVSTTFTLGGTPPPDHHPLLSSLSSSPESANSGSLHESNIIHCTLMEKKARPTVHFSSPSKNLRRENLGLQKIDDSSVLGADAILGLKLVDKEEIVSSRQTRNWLKKQTSSATVFTMCGEKPQGAPAQASAHINKSNSGSAKANFSAGKLTEDCQGQLPIQGDLNEDMTRILDQLKASFKLEE